MEKHAKMFKPVTQVLGSRALHVFSDLYTKWKRRVKMFKTVTEVLGSPGPADSLFARPELISKMVAALGLRRALILGKLSHFLSANTQHNTIMHGSTTSIMLKCVCACECACACTCVCDESLDPTGPVSGSNLVAVAFMGHENDSPSFMAGSARTNLYFNALCAGPNPGLETTRSAPRGTPPKRLRCRASWFSGNACISGVFVCAHGCAHDCVLRFQTSQLPVSTTSLKHPRFDIRK